jgi:hypothetical protein
VKIWWTLNCYNVIGVFETKSFQPSDNAKIREMYQHYYDSLKPKHCERMLEQVRGLLSGRADATVEMPLVQDDEELGEQPSSTSC